MRRDSQYFIFLVLCTSSAFGVNRGPIMDLEEYFSTHTDDSQERVVGGAGVADDVFINYQISMQFKSNNGEYHHFCGGSIISESHILTAAHCVKGQNLEKITVLAGINDLSDTSGKRSKVVSADIHENYEELKTSDIAVLKIDPPLELDGDKIDKIDVSGTELVGGNQEVILTGWGSTWHIGQGPFVRLPKRLQRLSYKTITNEQCKRSMDQLTDTEICARERFGKGACNGDSGGPLVMKNGDRLKQVGIVSYGTAPCAINSPDVYTRVSMFDDWLQKRMA